MNEFEQLVALALAKEIYKEEGPYLKNDGTNILERESFLILQKIRAVVQDERLDDPECFHRVEEIICLLESAGLDGGVRHDFG